MNLNQITIASKGTKESVAFYKTLGLRLIVDALPRYARLECPDGGSTFSIHESEGPIENNSMTLYFENDDLDEVVTSLKQKGLNFTSDPEDKPWLWREAHLRDPDGHQIILFHAGENRKNPPWRID